MATSSNAFLSAETNDRLAANMPQLSGTKWRKKAERHQGKHFPIAHHQLGKSPGRKVVNICLNISSRSGEIGIAEEYPAETNEVERNDDAEEAADATTAFPSSVR